MSFHVVYTFMLEMDATGTATVNPVIPAYDPNTRVRPGYALFTFPPKRFPPDYVKTR